ncbi:hypothetical protein [Streptomyces sp. NPDC059452]|uniref:hypothetical protein n=1 Tax=Streptomyces sp. NPDC059452 TaxID=3346835 RepID=UPI0036765986
MLQCTAFAEVPPMGALVVLTAMNTEPGRTPVMPELDEMLLCELGEHDKETEHAAQLWAAEMSAARDLWMFWTDTDTDTGMRRKFRFAEVPPCLAVLRDLATDEGEACLLFDRHSAPHSWHVTDPLADLVAEQVREEVRRERGGDGDEDGDGDGDGDGGTGGGEGPESVG